jgi:hypothetical protein
VRNSSYKYELLLHDRTLASTSRTRLSCDYEKYSNIIWHTHPRISKFYPSIEDIEKVIKIRPENIIKDSYIVTNFGVWRLSAINYIEIDENIKLDITTILNQLYNNTNRGREYESNAVNTAINDLNDLLENILNVNFFTYPL